MSRVSCENCNAINTELFDVQMIVPTVFGELEIELTLCKTCKSGIEFCQYTMIETYEFLSEKMKGRAMQFNNKLKRTMK